MNNPIPLDFQPSHIEKILGFLKNRNFYIDNSDTGLGKTYISGFIVKELKLDGIFVICPKSVLDNWETVFKQFGINILFSSTYESFRGTEANPPKHGFLTIKTEIHEDENNKQIKKLSYHPTEKLKTLMKEKNIMFVFDEFHRCKNDSIQNLAVSGINRYIRKVPTCYSAFLTATSYTEVSSSWNLFRAIGLSNESVLFEHSLARDIYTLLGYNDVLNYGRSLDSTCTGNLKPYFLRKNSIEEDTHNILCNYIFPKIMASMDRQDFEYSITNTCIVANDSVSKICERLIAAIILIIKNDGEGPRMGNKKEAMGNLRLMMHLLEIIKAYYVLELVKQKLAEEPDSKVVIYVNYLDVLHYIKTELEYYHPLVLHGGTPLAVREKNMKAFNAPNNKERVFLSIVQAGGVGISLHDKHGGFPRHTYIMADYQLIPIKQSFGRTIRAGMKSPSYVHLCYMMPKEEEKKEDMSVIEFKVFRALNKKSDILRQASSKENQNQKLPCDLELIPKMMNEIPLEPYEHIRRILENFNEPQKLDNFKKKVRWLYEDPEEYEELEEEETIQYSVEYVRQRRNERFDPPPPYVEPNFFYSNSVDANLSQMTNEHLEIF